jgi:hypothetical protein
MIYRTERSKIDEYFINPSFSQSALKALHSGYHVYKKYKQEPEKKRYYDESPEHMLRGSMVDCIFTEGMDVYNQQYHVGTMTTKPSPTIMSIIHRTLALIKETRTSTDADNPEPEIPFGILDQENYHPFIVQSAREHGYQANYRDPALITAVIREGAEYWNELLTANGRTVVSLEEHNNAILIASSILNSESVKTHIYLGYSDIATSTDVDFHFQLPIYTNIDGVDLKGLLDLVVVDHRRGIIFVVDNKVIYDTTRNFHYLMRKRELDFQVSFYTHILRRALPRELGDISRYRIETPKFIVESSKYPNDVEVFALSKRLEEYVLRTIPEYYTTGISANGFINLPYKGSPGLTELIHKAKLYIDGHGASLVDYGFSSDKLKYLDLHDVKVATEEVNVDTNLAI